MWPSPRARPGTAPDRIVRPRGIVSRRAPQPRDSNVGLMGGWRQRHTRSISQAGAGVNHHHRRGDERDLFAAAAVLGEHFAERDDQLLAAANDAADPAQPLTLGWRQQ